MKAFSEHVFDSTNFPRKVALITEATNAIQYITLKSIFNFFFIRNKDLLISKKETPKYTGGAGVYNQLQKLHKSIFNILERAYLLRTIVDHEPICRGIKNQTEASKNTPRGPPFSLPQTKL